MHQALCWAQKRTKMSRKHCFSLREKNKSLPILPIFNSGAELLFFLFLAVLGLHCCIQALSSWERGLLSSCGAWTSHWGGFTCCRTWALGLTVCSSCDTQTYLPCGIRNLPKPGMEPCNGRQTLNHWTSREVQNLFLRRLHIFYGGLSLTKVDWSKHNRNLAHKTKVCIASPFTENI